MDTPWDHLSDSNKFGWVWEPSRGFPSSLCLTDILSGSGTRWKISELQGRWSRARLHWVGLLGAVRQKQRKGGLFNPPLRCFSGLFKTELTLGAFVVAHLQIKEAPQTRRLFYLVPVCAATE